ncbi:sulfotransferase family protein [Mesonia aquimarina]|uniref:sulfotransferase family protein n=1 Tax=Mesonia aquimarina TaxID=1504967 RepID=UPI000EF5E5B0|nr:sulfotransferase [Mesonia aquimarina]
MKKASEKPIFFIVCAGRSGSTLMQLMLDANPNIIAPIESRFIIFLYAKYAHTRKWNYKQLLQFYEDLFLDEKIYYLWNLDRENLKQEILNQPSNTSFSQLCKLVYAHYISFFEKENKQIIVDKNPINSLFIPELLKLFPKAKFIHLIRDPRASCRSHCKAEMQPNYFAAAYMWKDYNTAIEKNKSKLPKNRFLSVYYEHFVDNPIDTLKEISQFLGIEFNSKMLNFNEHLKKGIVEELIEKNTAESKMKLQLFHKYHKNTKKPINKNSLNLWKNDLSEEDIAVIEKICMSFMKQYNYKTVSDIEIKTPFLEKLTHQVKNYIIKIYYLSPVFMRVFYSNINSSLKPKIFHNISDEIKKLNASSTNR